MNFELPELYFPQRGECFGYRNTCSHAHRNLPEFAYTLAHKLLCTIFFMLDRGEYYRDSATVYEALSVQCNAARWIKTLIRFGFIPKPA